LETKITSNQHEHSTTITRQDGTTIDFVGMPGEVTIGQNNPDGTHVNIPLNLEEAQVLHEKLAAVFS
jgi:hypothetical protein